MRSTIFAILVIILGGLFLNACNSDSKKVESEAIYTQTEDQSSTEPSNSSLQTTPTSLDTSSLPSDLRNVSDETEKLLYLIDARGSRKLYPSLDEALKDDPENVFRLNLHAQNITQLSKRITDLYNLEELYLSGNKLTSLPDSFGIKLKGLKVLDLSNNKFQRLPEQLGGLNNLAYLNISSNQVVSLPATLNGLLSLQILNLENNAFRSIPSEVFQLNSLEYLFLEGITLKIFPEEIGQLSGLKRLSIRNCGLKEIPASVLSLDKLERLILSNNQIVDVPSSLKKLKQINFLDLSANRIKSGIEPIISLNKLNHLDLSTNPIDSIPPGFFVEGKLDLKLLNLSHTNISSLSTGIKNFKNLIWLAVVGTPIQALPGTLAECKRIQVVQLGRNQALNLSNALEILGALPRLKSLEITHMTTGNETFQIPTQLVELKALVKLDLRGNRFADLNGELDKFAQLITKDKLQALNLSKCGIRKTDQDFVKLSALHLLGIDEKNMYNGEAIKLSQTLPNVQIVDGSDYFDYRF